MATDTLAPPKPDVFGLTGLPALLPSDGANLAGQSDEDTGREHLSNSSISSLSACTQKYGFEYDAKIEPIMRAAPLSMGSAFQHAIEVGDPKAGVEKLISEGGAVFEQADEDRRRIQGAIVGAAAEAYLSRWEVDPDSEREFEYRVRLRNPWTGAYSRTFDLLGFADELGYQDGHRVLTENKLVGTITELNIRKLPLDRQIALACYGVWRATGEEITRVRYRWTRKPSIRQKQNESVEAFCERVIADYGNRPDFYLHEESVYRSTADLVRIEAELWEWAERVRHARRQRLWARNTSYCHEYGGCPFIPICLGDSDAAGLYQPKTSNTRNANHQQEEA